MEDVRGTTVCRNAQTEERANVDSRMHETLGQMKRTPVTTAKSYYVQSWRSAFRDIS